jgi:anti-sigma28 factor (negative regulator of flagellin synthesis)
MVGIQGVGGIPEPKPERPAKVREKEQDATQSSLVKDGVLISSEAQAAAKLASTIQAQVGSSDVRTERVAGAKERIERGEYRNPEVVAKVAERVSKYLP